MNALTTNLGPESQGRGSPHGPTSELNDILALVDFSRASQHGLAFAAELAGRFHSRLSLLHVVEPPVLPEWGYAHIPQREAKLRRAAEERLPQLPVECGIDSKLIHSADIRSGDAADEICKSAAEHHSDLIVLASHGLGGLQHAFFGSTAERAVRHAPWPVLVLREREQDFVKG